MLKSIDWLDRIDPQVETGIVYYIKSVGGFEILQKSFVKNWQQAMKSLSQKHSYLEKESQIFHGILFSSDEHVNLIFTAQE